MSYQATMNAELDKMRANGLSIDGDNAYKRDLLDAVTCALAYGKQRSAPPPAGHWLEPFYEMGKAEADERDAARSLPVGVPSIRDFADEVKQLCKDFSDLQNRPYMGDVTAAIDGLYEQFMQSDAMLAAPTVKAEQDDDRAECIADGLSVGMSQEEAEDFADKIAAPSAPAGEDVPVAGDPRDIAGDTGRADVDALIGRLTSSDPDFNDCADAAALLRRLVMEEISGPSGYATWRDAAVAERMKRVSMKPNGNIVQIAREGLEVYVGPNMNERKVCAEVVRLAEVYSTEQDPSLPAAGSAEWIEHGPSKACPFSSPYTSKVDVRLRDGTERLGDLACNTMWFWYEHDPKPYDVVAYRIAALSAQQSAPERVSVPAEFVRGFNTLAHNYSLRAVPPDYYDGMAGDAFKDAYARCGRDLAELRALLSGAREGDRSNGVEQNELREAVKRFRDDNASHAEGGKV